jgi:hypothetical protein
MNKLFSVTAVALALSPFALASSAAHAASLPHDVVGAWCPVNGDGTLFERAGRDGGRSATLHPLVISPRQIVQSNFTCRVISVRKDAVNLDCLHDSRHSKERYTLFVEHGVLHWLDHDDGCVGTNGKNIDHC